MKPSPLKTTLAHFVSDSACLFLSVGIAVILRAISGGDIDFISYLPLVTLWPVMVFYFFAVGLYPGILMPPQEELRKCIQGISCAFVCVWTISFFSRGFLDYSRLALLGGWALACMSVPFARHELKRHCSAKKWWGQPVVICGDTDDALRTCRHIEKYPRIGLKPEAVVSFPGVPPMEDTTFEAHPPFRSMEEAVKLSQVSPRPYALILLDSVSEEKQRVLMQFSQHFKRALFILTFFCPLGLWVSGTDLTGIFALEVNQKLLDPWRQKMKRIVDIIAVVVCSPLLLPLVGILSFLVWKEDRASVFYSQERVGKNGKPFRMWKFRTMVPDADKKLAEYLAKDPALKAEWEATQKLRHDPRVTKIGYFLRRTSLDELPQLWNVLTGEMSLVGPRPIVRDEIQKYGEVFDLYAKVSPGMTGYWQVSGRSSLSYAARLWLDSYYIRNWSIWFDLYIICVTPAALLRTKNAC